MDRLNDKREEVSMRKVMYFGLVLLVAGAMAFAGGAEEEEITLRWLSHSGTHVEAVEDYFAPLYYEETGVRVEIHPTGADQHYELPILQATAGTDEWHFGYLSPGRVGGMVAGNAIIDMTPFIEEHNFDISAYPELVWEGFAVAEEAAPGEILGIPGGALTAMTVYREDWINHPEEQAAFEEEYGRQLRAPESWQELYEVAEFFTRPAGDTVAGEVLEYDLYGYGDALAYQPGTSRYAAIKVYSAGFSGWDENYHSDMDHPIMVDLVEYMVELIDNTMPEEAWTWGWLEQISFFAEGRLAMANFWPHMITETENPDRPSAGNTGYMPLPKWEGNLHGWDQGTPFLGGGAIAIYDTPYAEEAFKFIQWLKEEMEDEWILRSREFSRIAHFENEELRNEPGMDKMLPAFLDTLDQVFLRQPIPEFHELFYAPLADLVVDVYEGDLTPQEGVDRYVNQMNQGFRDAGLQQ